MPLFEFKCNNGCGHFEVFRKFEELNEVRCPACKGKVTRLYSPFAFTFGFQLTEKSYERGQPMELERRL